MSHRELSLFVTEVSVTRTRGPIFTADGRIDDSFCNEFSHILKPETIDRFPLHKLVRNYLEYQRIFSLYA